MDGRPVGYAGKVGADSSSDAGPPGDAGQAAPYSLADDLAAGPLHFGEVVWIGRCLADQLDRWHGLDVLLGIVTPAGVVWSADGRPRLTRSAASAAMAATGRSAPQEPNGLDGFIAPEVRAGLPVTIESDVYSLGVMLTTALVGGSSAVTGDALREALPDDVPIPLIEVLERATARSPIDRYFTAAALRDALDDVLEVDVRRWPYWGTVKALSFAAAVVVVAWIGAIAAHGLADRPTVALELAAGPVTIVDPPGQSPTSKSAGGGAAHAAPVSDPVKTVPVAVGTGPAAAATETSTPSTSTSTSSSQPATSSSQPATTSAPPNVASDADPPRVETPKPEAKAAEPKAATAKETTASKSGKSEKDDDEDEVRSRGSNQAATGSNEDRGSARSG